MKKIQTCLICGKELSPKAKDNLICTEHIQSLDEPQKLKLVNHIQKFKIDYNSAQKSQQYCFIVLIAYSVLSLLFVLDKNFIPFNPYYLLIAIPILIFLEYCLISNRKTVLQLYSNWLKTEIANPEKNDQE